MNPRIIGSLAVLLLLSVVQEASASVTIGQLASDPMPYCSDQFDYLQPTVISGNGYVVPGTGTVTSWSTAAAASANRQMAMKIFRKVGDPNVNTYEVVGHDGPHSLDPSKLNTFATGIPVRPGDVLGVSTPSGANSPACQFSVPGETYLSRFPPLADGAQGNFGPYSMDSRINATAVFEPSNSFTLGRVTRNRKKGTATETATVPNPGTLTVSGDGAKQAGSSMAKTAVSVPAPGSVQLTIRARGKKKRTLNSTGKVKISPTITYTPTGGTARSLQLKVKLRKKL